MSLLVNRRKLLCHVQVDYLLFSVLVHVSDTLARDQPLAWATCLTASRWRYLVYGLRHLLTHTLIIPRQRVPRR
jgi:hypothetical protein